MKKRHDESLNWISQVKRILIGILIINIAVAVSKYGYGLAINSVAMQADGVHSLFDGLSNVVGLIGISLAARPADHDHPYGHRKFETGASLVIGLLLIVVAYNIFMSAYHLMVDGGSQIHVDLGSFIVMIITLIINIGITWYERKRARELKSTLLMSDAAHTSSDVLVSLSVLAGLALSYAGIVVADIIISIVVGIAILFAAFSVFKQVSEVFSDESRIKPDAIYRALGTIEGITNIHDIRTRGTAHEVWLDMHMLVEPGLTVLAAHKLCDTAESRLRDEFPELIDITIHMEPDTPEERQKACESLTSYSLHKTQTTGEHL